MGNVVSGNGWESSRRIPFKLLKVFLKKKINNKFPENKKFF